MEHIVKLLREGDNFILAGHTAPDGDAVGSCFALAIALGNMGKNVRVVMEPIARKYENIPGRGFLFDGETDSLEPEIFVALDCADVLRLGSARSLFERAKTTACIDHHETNIGFAQLNYIEPHASSASEMTFNVIDRLTEITPDIAAAAYAGMVSDTGGFRYNATAKSTMETAARLMEMIPFTQIYNELMHVHSFAAGKAFGIALANSARTSDKKIVYSFITRDELKSVDSNKTDLDGVVEYLLGTRHALMAIFAYEKSDGTKVSLRSHGPNAGRVALKLGGGGHMLAAGATVQAPIEEALERAISLATREIMLYDGSGRQGDGSSVFHESRKTEEPSPCLPVDPLGVLNIRKEKGFTSHDVVAVVRKIAQTKRVGHTGTLDPDATGVLPVCLGRATKFADFISAQNKTYLAEIVLGVTTDTGDISGEILTQTDASAVTFEQLKSVAESFKFEKRGTYMQTPPMYSAVKVGGKKLYELARQGKTVERKPRPVKILQLEVKPPREDGKIFMEVTCSKGTYIRSLCMDIGEKLGCGAAMGELTRTASGIFSIENAHTLDEVKSAAEAGRLGELLLPLAKLVPHPAAYVTPDGFVRAINGSAIPGEFVTSKDALAPGDKCWLYAQADGELIGLFSRTQKKFIPEVML